MSFISDVKKVRTSIGTVLKKTYGPLAKLDHAGLREFNILNNKDVFRYPLEVGDSQLYPHTVEFQAWIPKPAAIGEVDDKIKSNLTDWAGAMKDGAEGKRINAMYDENASVTRYGRQVEQLRINANRQKNNRVIDWSRNAEPSDLLVLYTPAGSWNDQVQNQYTEASLTAALGNLGLFGEAASTFMKAFKANGGDFTDKLFAGANALGSSPAGVEALMRVLGGAAQQVGVVGDAGQLTDMTLQSLGYAVNPQFEMLYSGTSMREFQFDFTMTPRTVQEAMEIQTIVEKFKYHASPDMNVTNGRYIVPPSYFDITFKYKNERNWFLPLISTCALRAVDINYSGGLDTFATFEDGRPIQTQMVLRFVELEMMHKNLRAGGY